MSDPTPLKHPQATQDVELVEDVPGTKQILSSEKAFTGHGAGEAVARSKAEKSLVLKLDLTIVPLSTLIYFVAYLDRNSIGNARLMGLEKDLGLSSEQFYNCLVSRLPHASPHRTETNALPLPCCVEHVLRRVHRLYVARKHIPAPSTR
jgi:hypothetical protein